MVQNFDNQFNKTAFKALKAINFEIFVYKIRFVLGQAISLLYQFIK
jgi:hypothetical protein